MSTHNPTPSVHTSDLPAPISPLAEDGYGGPFRTAERQPWDGQPWASRPALPEGFRYLPIVRHLGRWWAQAHPITLNYRTVALIPLDGDEAVVPDRSPVAVVAATGDEGPYALVYAHHNPHPRQAPVETYAIAIVPRLPSLDEF